MNLIAVALGMLGLYFLAITLIVWHAPLVRFHFLLSACLCAAGASYAAVV